MKRLLPRMAKGRMPEIVSQGYGLGEIFVKAEYPANPARNLRYLNAVCQAGSKQITFVVYENLRSRSRWKSVRIDGGTSGWRRPRDADSVAA